MRAPNITPDADTGIGTWSEQQFVSRFKIWERTPERVLPAAQRRNNTVMPWKQLGGMTRDDLARHLRVPPHAEADDPPCASSATPPQSRADRRADRHGTACASGPVGATGYTEAQWISDSKESARS